MESENLLDKKGVAILLAQDEEAVARKELAKKQREKAMAQIQNMQRKFLERTRSTCWIWRLLWDRMKCMSLYSLSITPSLKAHGYKAVIEFM